MRTHTYFISDMHLGLQLGNPAERERKVVRWLNHVSVSAKEIYMLGDIFDFWWEYKYVVPRGYVRFLGKLAELTDSGVIIHCFTGNHDLWMRDYLQKECGVIMHFADELLTIGGKRFYLGHGDSKGRTTTDKIRHALFGSHFLRRLFSAVHPRWAFAWGYAWSKSSRLKKGVAFPFRGEQETLFQFAQQKIKTDKIDYFVFGHRHTPTLMGLPNSAKFIILSDWIDGCTYADFDGEKMELKTFEN